jgi:hypothetical protein
LEWNYGIREEGESSEAGAASLPRLRRCFLDAYVGGTKSGMVNRTVSQNVPGNHASRCCKVRRLVPDLLPDARSSSSHVDGHGEESDQLNAMKFLRCELQPYLGSNVEWQHQAYDHVLREEERKRNAFSKTSFYILANPVRAGLTEPETKWPFGGCVIPGYPRLHPMQEDFWELFWKLYMARRES